MHPSGLWFRTFLRLRNLVLKRAHGFAAITADIADELETVGINPNAVRRIPNSVNTARFYPVNGPQKHHLRCALNLPKADTIVIYIGRLVTYKGLPLLLRVWQDIQRTHQQVHLLIVGAGGLDMHNCEADLKAYVEANGLQHSVHFTGSVQNAPDYLQASDIFVLPSENDAFPSAVVEAMACSLPVITTSVGAMKRIIADRQNGLMVQPGHFQQLYDALDCLITDPELAFRLGQSAYQTVQNRYSAEIVTQAYIKLFSHATSAYGKIARENI